MLVCKAINAIDIKDFHSAIKHIDKALELFPQNKETRFYRITIQVEIYKETNNPELERSLLRNLDEFIRDKKNEHMLYYFRGLLYLYKQEFSNALKDFNRAINYCDTIVGKYYLGRAQCYACISMFADAIKDLNVAIEANSTFIEAYILRGKCAFISGDTKQAFSDFQEIIQIQPEDPQMHIHAGNILMMIGAYEQAINAYTNAYTLKDIPMALSGRAKCFISLCEISKALDDREKMAKQDAYEFKQDIEMLKILGKINKDIQENDWNNIEIQIDKLINGIYKKKGHEKLQLLNNIELDTTSIFGDEDLLLYRGVCKFYQSKYSDALEVNISIIIGF